MLIDHRRAQVRVSHNVADKRRILGLSHRIRPKCVPCRRSSWLRAGSKTNAH
jgi:hypothetical protein